MNEINRHTSKNVYLDIIGDTADQVPTATVTVNGELIGIELTVDATNPPDGVDQRYFVTLSMAYTQNDGPLKVTWEFTIDGIPVVKEDYFEVVTPYLTLKEIRKIRPNIAEEDAWELESIVRYTINSHTGQSFGKSNKTITVRSNGDRAIKLPERLMELTSVSNAVGTFNTAGFYIASDGWYLRAVQPSVLTYKQMPNDYSLDHGPVIQTPYTAYYDNFLTGDVFDIAGKWGYDSVPMQVRTAARLLADDFSCNEVAYRDKYLEAISASDWRLQLSPEAWAGTGNVRADHLLSEFVILDWAVV